MPRGSLICEMRAITRLFTGLKISIVFVAGRVITTCPFAMATWLKPGSPGRSTIATWRSLAPKPVATQLRTTRKKIKRRKVDLELRIPGACRQRCWMPTLYVLLPWNEALIAFDRERQFRIACSHWDDSAVLGVRNRGQRAKYVAGLRIAQHEHETGVPRGPRITGIGREIRHVDRERSV